MLPVFHECLEAARKDVNTYPSSSEINEQVQKTEQHGGIDGALGEAYDSAWFRDLTVEVARDSKRGGAWAPEYLLSSKSKHEPAR